MSQLAEALKQIFSKLASFFDIIDLSFFVAGALAFAALAFHVHRLDSVQQTQLEQAASAREEVKGKANRELVQAEESATAANARITLARNEILALVGKSEPEAEAKKTHWNIQLQAAERDRDAARSTAARVSGEIARLQAETLAAAKNIPLLTRLVTPNGVVLTIIGIYILGLICFATGRFVVSCAYKLKALFTPGAEVRQPAHAERMREIIKSHGVGDDEPFVRFMSRWVPFPPCADDKQKRELSAANYRLGRSFYARLWTWVRESERKESDEHVHRYWVRAATYEGVAFALLIWAAVTARWAYEIGTGAAWIVAAVCLPAAYACYRESRVISSSLGEEVVVAVVEDQRLVAAGKKPATT